MPARALFYGKRDDRVAALSRSQCKQRRPKKTNRFCTTVGEGGQAVCAGYVGQSVTEIFWSSFATCLQLYRRAGQFIVDKKGEKFVVVTHRVDSNLLKKFPAGSLVLPIRLNLLWCIFTGSGNRVQRAVVSGRLTAVKMLSPSQNPTLRVPGSEITSRICFAGEGLYKAGSADL